MSSGWRFVAFWHQKTMANWNQFMCVFFDVDSIPSCLSNPYHLCIWYIYLHEWLIFTVNVGKYTGPMDGMGKCCFKMPMV